MALFHDAMLKTADSSHINNAFLIEDVSRETWRVRPYERNDEAQSRSHGRTDG